MFPKLYFAYVVKNKQHNKMTMCAGYSEITPSPQGREWLFKRVLNLQTLSSMSQQIFILP